MADSVACISVATPRGQDGYRGSDALHHGRLGQSLLFADTFGALYGQYAATVGQTQLESNFNAWQSRKMWAVFEEVVSRDQRYNQVGKIKHLVTGKTVRMESKFINGWEEANHMNAVFLSNEILPWPISDSDRRMLVMWPMETLPVARQKAIGRELENGGVAALYGWLLRVDLGASMNAPARPALRHASGWLRSAGQGGRRSCTSGAMASWAGAFGGMPFD